MSQLQVLHKNVTKRNLPSNNQERKSVFWKMSAFRGKQIYEVVSTIYFGKACLILLLPKHTFSSGCALTQTLNKGRASVC